MFLCVVCAPSGPFQGKMGKLHVATNFIRHLTNSIRQLDTCFLNLKLQKVRSRLYRGRFLRPNTRWKALDEIYNFHILLATYLKNAVCARSKLF